MINITCFSFAHDVYEGLRPKLYSRKSPSWKQIELLLFLRASRRHAKTKTMHHVVGPTVAPHHVLHNELSWPAGEGL